MNPPYSPSPAPSNSPIPPHHNHQMPSPIPPVSSEAISTPSSDIMAQDADKMYPQAKQQLEAPPSAGTTSSQFSAPGTTGTPVASPMVNQAQFATASPVDSNMSIPPPAADAAEDSYQSQVVEYNPDSTVQSPLVVLLLSLLLPGLGHVVLKQTEKGFVYLGIIVVMWLISFLLCYVYVGWILFVIPVLYTCLIVLDAFLMARRLKENGDIYKGECSNFLAAFGLKVFLRDTMVFVTGSGRDPRRASRV